MSPRHYFTRAFFSEPSAAEEAADVRSRNTWPRRDGRGLAGRLTSQLLPPRESSFILSLSPTFCVLTVLHGACGPIELPPVMSIFGRVNLTLSMLPLEMSLQFSQHGPPPALRWFPLFIPSRCCCISPAASHQRQFGRGITNRRLNRLSSPTEAALQANERRRLPISSLWRNGSSPQCLYNYNFHVDDKNHAIQSDDTLSSSYYCIQPFDVIRCPSIRVNSILVNCYV